MIVISTRMLMPWEIANVLEDLDDGGYAAEVDKKKLLITIDADDSQLDDINKLVKPRVARIVKEV